MSKGRKLVVITGVTRGLGRAMAEALIQLGHTVAGCGKRQSLIHPLQRQHGTPHSFTIVDVTSDTQVKTWARHLLTHHGPPDLLLNNAGATIDPQRFWEVTDYALSKIIDVNIRGVANTIRYFLPGMMTKQRGVIVNFSSGWGRSTDAYMAPYCMTKWAIEGLTQALSKELPHGLAAVAFNPGIINTDMLKICLGEDANQYPSPEEWARKAIPFLLSLGASHNGKALTSPA